jgi:hypothetical protein
VGHVWRALLEAYAYALRHHVEMPRELGHRPTRFVASDGGARSRIWMQIVADVLEAPVRLLEDHPGSCLGAAWTAAIGVGAATSWSGIDAFVAPGALLAPQPANAAVYEAGYARYRALYARLAPLCRASQARRPSVAHGRRSCSPGSRWISRHPPVPRRSSSPATGSCSPAGSSPSRIIASARRSSSARRRSTPSSCAARPSAPSPRRRAS